jgi:hypothetical protein
MSIFQADDFPDVYDRARFDLYVSLYVYRNLSHYYCWRYMVALKLSLGFLSWL